MRRRSLYRRIYFHGVLLLVATVVALALTGFFVGRDARHRAHPTVLGTHVGSLLAAVPDVGAQHGRMGAVARVAADEEPGERQGHHLSLIHI